MPEALADVAASMHDVVVVGSGPSGASCAHWLADAGWDVVAIDKKTLPREKTCGDGLTPRAVRQLSDMGLEPTVASVGHRYGGLRAVGFGQQLEMAWPAHPSFPSHGYTITRFDLDALVAGHAAARGATVLYGVEAIEPLAPVRPPVDTELTALDGVVVRDHDGNEVALRARYVVIADGSNSRLGRALGATRRRDWPLGMALRGYWSSPRHDDAFIESHLDIRDKGGDIVPGYGWVFPLGDGRVNVGVGMLSTDRSWKGVNTTRLLDAFLDQIAEPWQLDPGASLGAVTGGKLPMGLSVTPHAGRNVLAIGDAAGAINPFNGEGIAYGYETGRLAASFLGQALCDHDPKPLAQYPEALDAAYGEYYRVARGFVRLISEPVLMQACVRVGMRSDWLMRQLLAIMANLLRPDDLGAAELGYRAIRGAARHVPDAVFDALLTAMDQHSRSHADA
jgi:geranylgeranyl reductase family protein